MNDFTKEELLQLNKSLIVDMKHNRCTEIMDSVREKIINMIDNYSEINTPTMADYCCNNCNEEWHKCECEK
jgi:short-subunit dehydrogenase